MKATPISRTSAPVTQRSRVRFGSSTRMDRALIWVSSQLILVFFTVIIVYPVIWMVLASFKSNTEVVTNIWGLPEQLNWQ